MKCDECPFLPSAGPDGDYDDCAYFEGYGTVWKDGREGCTLTRRQIEKKQDEYATYLGDMGTDMGLEMDFEHHGIDMLKTIEHCKHMLGMDIRKTYRRHGKEFYKPYRNYWYGNEPGLEYMSHPIIGLAEKDDTGELPYYFLTKEGFRWLERQIHITIRPVED